MNRQTLVRTLFILCIAAYPFIVFFGISYFPPSFFGIVLLVLLGLRFGVLLPEERKVLLPMLLVLMAYALAATLLKSESLLLYYPALVNFSLCAIFLSSLRDGESILLRLVKSRGMVISSYGPGYLHRLTAVWAGFFAVNGVISIWTSTISIEVWTLYNGLIAYFLVALLMGGEYLFRRRYKKKMGVDNP